MCVSCALKYHRDERDRHLQTVPSKRGISRSALRRGARPRLRQSPIYVAHFLANTFISDERRKCHNRRCDATFSIVPRRKYDRLARCHALTETSLYVLTEIFRRLRITRESTSTIILDLTTFIGIAKLRLLDRDLDTRVFTCYIRCPVTSDFSSVL